MANLISPNVSISIIDESFYINGNGTSVPIIFIATADEKYQPDGITFASGTLTNNVLYEVTSLRQSIELFGVPKFLSTNGVQHHGDVRNEQGLDCLNKYLEIGNRAYVIRANVNLNDNLVDLRTMWTRKIAEAGGYLSDLVEDYIDVYNTANNLLPVDSNFKESVTAAELLDLIPEALSSTFQSYSFSSDAFQTAFLQDHTVAHPGYQDVLFDTFNGFLQTSDITGLEDDVTYGADVEIVSAAGTEIFNLEFLGSDIVNFGDLIDAIEDVIGIAGQVALLNGRLRITSSLDGVTSEVNILLDGPSGTSPLFSSLNLYRALGTSVPGVGTDTKDVYNASYTTVTGVYDGLTANINDWTGGSIETDEFTGEEASGLLLSAAAVFDNTREFRQYTSLGENDAARRVNIVRQMQAAINNPNSQIRAESIEFDIAVAPGFPECADELIRLSENKYEEVFVIGETPVNKPPTGPLGISTWAATPARATSYHSSYYYGHGISSNIDGVDILTTAASTALRVYANSDELSEVFFAPAGSQRGVCPHLTDVGYVTGALGGPTTFVQEFLDNGARDSLYEFPKNINPITFIPGRGILVLGQKTTYNATSALDSVSTSRLVKFIKRRLRKALFPFLFEPNDKITRRNAKFMVDTFLAGLVDRRGIYDFAVLCDETNNTAGRIDNKELWIDIAIKPTKFIEFIYVPIRVVNTGANIGGRTTIFT